jgi:flagellar hook protein FlgE
MPFRIALSGLNAASTDLEVTGNNIANSATNGFKESRAEFSDVYANAIQDNSANAAGQGVRVARVAQQFSQGTIDFTSNNLDLAISGQGFFVLQSPDGTQAYTRAGAYSVDRDGYVINHARDRLQIYEAATGVGGVTAFNTGILSDLRLPTTPSAPQTTTEMEITLNLNANAEQPSVAFDRNNTESYNRTTSTTVYDSLGNAHTAQLYYRMETPSGPGLTTWTQHMYVGGDATPDVQTLDFDSSGNLVSPASIVTSRAFDPSNGAATTMPIDMNLANMTQFGSAFEVNRLSQNGYTSGRLAGVDIDPEGVVFARYTNGQSAALGKVALAKFNNQQGLRQVGDTNWVESFASGSPQFGEAGTSSFGQIQSGALESSNVDIAEQLVKLITAQRNFQANAESISTADTVTQTIINIR